MIELGESNAVEYAQERGWIHGPARAELLAGGVSNCVLRIDAVFHNPIIVKQSRPRLRTRAEWFSDVERIHREEDAQRLLAEALPGRVPRVLFSDRANFAYAMECAPSSDNWKMRLLACERDEATARTAGELLRDLHAITPPEAFAERTAFVQLRVDPFYRRVQEKHPDLDLSPLIDDLLTSRKGLVHGDFSPKNLLVCQGGLVLVDHETCHFGEPAFDVGFFFSHLFLKAIRFPGMLPLIEAARQGYGESETFRRGLPHLGACLLARIDGTSPVDYLPEEKQGEMGRSLGKLLLGGASWEEIVRALPAFPLIRG